MIKKKFKKIIFEKVISSLEFANEFENDEFNLPPFEFNAHQLSLFSSQLPLTTSIYNTTISTAKPYSAPAKAISPIDICFSIHRRFCHLFSTL